MNTLDNVDNKSKGKSPFFILIAIGFGIFIITTVVNCTQKAFSPSSDRRESSPSRSITKSATFYSMQSCLTSIRSKTGAQLKIVTDTPDRVSGQISGGGFFGCQRVESGSKGTYYEGWYSK